MEHLFFVLRVTAWRSPLYSPFQCFRVARERRWVEGAGRWLARFMWLFKVIYHLGAFMYRDMTGKGTQQHPRKTAGWLAGWSRNTLPVKAHCTS